MEVINMRKSIKRLVSVVCMIALVVCLFSGSAFAAGIGSGGPKPPVPPIDFHLSFIEFDGVKLYNTTIPQGYSTSVYGFVIQARSTVTVKATVKKYYNSYSAYTVQTFTETRYPVLMTDKLEDTNIFKSQLNLQSRSAGHYVLEIQAKEYGRTISTSLSFYIT